VEFSKNKFKYNQQLNVFGKLILVFLKMPIKLRKKVVEYEYNI